MPQEKILGNQLNITTVADEIAADPGAASTVAGGMNLNELADVSAGSPTTGQVLTYSNSPAGWQAQDAPAGGGGSVTNPLSSDLDVGGYEITAADTAGSPNAGNIVITSGSSTYAGTNSYAGKVTIKGGDRLYEGDYTGVIPAGGSPANRNSVSILAGSGSGYGGGIELIAGTSGGQYGEGGDINITAGEATHATNGYSGNVFLRGGNHSGTYYLGNGGNVDLYGGYSTHGYGGNVRLSAGNSAGVGAPGSISLTAGSAQLAGSPVPAQQYAGFVRIIAGKSRNDVGGTEPGGVVEIKSGSAIGGNANGGAIVLTPGFGQGSGVAGVVSIVAELDMNARNVIDVNSIYYRDEFDIGAGNTIQFTVRNHIKASPVGATSYAFSVFASLGTGHYQLKLVDGLNNNPSWPATVKWQNNTEPTWTANTDIISFYYDRLTGDYYAINVALGFV